MRKGAERTPGNYDGAIRRDRTGDLPITKPRENFQTGRLDLRAPVNHHLSLRLSLASVRAQFFSVRSQGATGPSTALNVELTLTGSRLLINCNRFGSR